MTVHDKKASTSNCEAGVLSTQRVRLKLKEFEEITSILMFCLYEFKLRIRTATVFVF